MKRTLPHLKTLEYAQRDRMGMHPRPRGGPALGGYRGRAVHPLGYDELASGLRPLRLEKPRNGGAKARRVGDVGENGEEPRSGPARGAQLAG